MSNEKREKGIKEKKGEGHVCMGDQTGEESRFEGKRENEK